MPRIRVAMAIVMLATLPLAHAQDSAPMPDKLTFGYDDEGKVDASPAGCAGYDIAACCLDMGRNMLDEETSWLTTDPKKERAHLSP
jgi:hypothetical protein